MGDTPLTEGGLCPSLAVAINCPRPYLDDPTGYAEKDKVTCVLGAVWQQLQESFDWAWDWHCGDETPAGPEEAWARRLAEKLVGLPYNSPGQVYLNNNTRDRDVLWWAQNDTDPACPVVSACQQLVDLAVMFAGFTIDDSAGQPFGFNQDGSQQGPLSKLTVQGTPTPGRWVSTGEQNALAVIAAHQDFGPLAMYPFSDPVAGPSRGCAHIGAVLRVNTDRARFQFIDTGGMNTPEPERPRPKFSNGMSGIYEYAWASTANGPASGKCDGMGIIPVSSFAQALPTGMTRMARARPLGFARFVLATPAKRVLLATRLLPMHAPNRPNMNFSVAKYIWSLRYMPFRSEFVGHWIIYVPRGDLAREMLASPANHPERRAGRQYLVDEVVNAAYGRAQRTPPAVLDGDHLLPAIIYRTTPDVVPGGGGGWTETASFADGIVRGLAAWKKQSTVGSEHSWLFNHPWATRSGDVQLDDGDFADFPYLAGEWRG